MMALHPACHISSSSSFGGRYVRCIDYLGIPANTVILEETPIWMWTLNASSSSSKVDDVTKAIDDACSSSIFAPLGSHPFADLEGVDDDDVDVMIAILREPAKARDVLNKGFVTADDVLKHLLQDNSCPEAGIVTHLANKLADKTKSIAQTMLNALKDQQQAAQWTVEDVATLLQIKQLNSMAIGAGRGEALFEFGCLFAHACTGATPGSANLTFRFVEERGVMRFSTTRQINAGELVCISYLGIGCETSRRIRRAVLLESKLFLCRCARCNVLANDLCRQLPCAKCNPRDEDGMLDMENLVDDEDRWKRDSQCAACVPITQEPSKEDSAVLDTNDAVAFCANLETTATSAWRCRLCGAITAGEPEIPSGIETFHENVAYNFISEVETDDGSGELVPEALESPDSKPARMLRKLPQIIERCAQHLGLAHWTTVRLRSVQLEHWRALASREFDALEEEQTPANRVRASKAALHAISLRAGVHFNSFSACRDIAEGALALHEWRQFTGFHILHMLTFELVELAMLFYNVSIEESRLIGMQQHPKLPQETLRRLALAWDQNREYARREYGDDFSGLEEIKKCIPVE